MSHAVRISNLSALAGYGIICITGGEPLLQPDRTLGIIARIRRQYPGAAIYLYSALYTKRMSEIVEAVDGIHYTLHEGATEADVEGPRQFQELIGEKGSGKSFRLYIDPRVRRRVSLRPDLWKRVEIKPWLTEEELLAAQPNGLPDETLFILEENNA